MWRRSSGSRSSEHRPHRSMGLESMKPSRLWLRSRPRGGNDIDDGKCKVTKDDICRNCSRTGLYAKDSMQPKWGGGQAHVVQTQANGEPALLQMHGSAELHTPSVPVATALVASALLHIDELRAHAFLSSS